MENLASGVLPREIVSDIGKKMQAIKDEMAALEETPPPHDFTVEQIKVWLAALKDAPDTKAIHLLIDRIEVYNKTDVRVFSTLTSVLGETGRGDRI